jgi:predicted HTH domain antitoxin
VYNSGMGVIHIDLPESILLSTGQSQEEFVKEAKFFVALKLFEAGRISSGRAADLCAMPRVEFLLLAGRSGVPVADLDAEELDREFLDG